MASDTLVHDGRFRPTAGVLLERTGRLLLVRRGAEPARGRWDVPGGFLEPGEDPEQAARREIREELGIEVGALRLLLADINPLADGSTVLDLIFEASHFTGEPRASDDAAEVGWFAADALPTDLAFDTTRRILERTRVLRTPRALRLLDGTPVDTTGLEPVGAFATPLDRLPLGWHPESGEWRLHDGLVCGRVDRDNPAALWLDRDVTGDHVITFDACTVAPHANDINAYWEGSGAIAEGCPDARCTIGGVSGWWDGLSGIERHPAGTPRSTCRVGPLEPGRVHRVVAGRRGSADFLFVDGVLAMQVNDADAPRRVSSRVALATWNSHVHFHRAAAYSLE